jgi:hypothetical protein
MLKGTIRPNTLRGTNMTADMSTTMIAAMNTTVIMIMIMIMIMITTDAACRSLDY